MRTNLTKAIDQRANMWAMRALLTATLIVAMAIISIQPAAAQRGPDNLADLVEQLAPAVVNISTVQTIRQRSRGNNRRLPQVPDGVPFEEFWEQFRDRFNEEQEPRQARSLGSGFIIDKSGIVITNNHVIEDADEITVILADGTEFDATLLGRDTLSDVAVLKIENEDNSDFPFVKWGDDEGSRIGDWVMAIGNPFGLSSTVTAGIISARNRPINNGDVEFIQTDASINRGNSGGPLFNLDGEVIGVNTAIFSPSGGNVGIGFSIPSNFAKDVVEQLQEHGKVRRGWLGVTIQALTEEIAETLELDIKDGAMITTVEPDSPADDAGLQESDIIVTWDGKPIKDSSDLSRSVKRTQIDKAVKVEIYRNGERQTVDVKTGAFQDPIVTEEGAEEGEDRPRERSDRELVEGMELAPLNDSMRQRHEIDDDIEGVVVLRVSRRSAAYRAGIRVGAVITRVNQQRVDNPAQIVDLFNEAIEEDRERILVLVSYRGNTVHIPLRLTQDE
ncbi:DegQ family serine endoprotease [Kordiimonas aquimaris]|uniref:DegQ family serine endoprotease n=1 Tax=Kordiimonas aquimaris TaxID=707591 RepID=UPI0021CF424C|nr:DegQ family serine endoprotease [Kordiimonas aquimaris]